MSERASERLDRRRLTKDSGSRGADDTTWPVGGRLLFGSGQRSQLPYEPPGGSHCSSSSSSSSERPGGARNRTVVPPISQQQPLYTKPQLLLLLLTTDGRLELSLLLQTATIVMTTVIEAVTAAVVTLS